MNNAELLADATNEMKEQVARCNALTALRQVRSQASTGTPYSAYRWRDPDQSAHTDWVAVDVNQDELVIADELILRQLDVLT